ncbi:MAG: glycosyltransferase family 4 protein [Armatimonadetes bacterium]|nr:glycosyltransferase family 4 protein [Armatimonadota bacterium]
MASAVQVVVIGHSCVIPPNQAIYAAAASHADLRLTLIAPARWNSSLHGPVEFRPLPQLAEQALPLPVRFSGDLHLHMYPALEAVLRRLRPDVVFLDEDPHSLVAWQVARLQKSLGFRLVIALRQNVYRRYPPPFDWIERDVLRNAHSAAATSQECLDVARRKGYGGEATIVYYPIDTELFTPPEVRQPARPFTVGYAGRLVRSKGLDCLIAACQRAQLEESDLRLLIVGDGPERERLRALAGRWLRPGSVTWRPSVRQEEMTRTYHEMDVVVLPSLTTRRWKEQFGRVLGEAMACGVPVLGSSSGFIPELIRVTGGGMVFPEGDPQTLARLLIVMAREPLHRRQLGEAGRAGVLAHYSLPVLARRVHDLLWRAGSG